MTYISHVFKCLTLAALVVVISFGLASAVYIGLSLAKPVALRMDADGISGWYTRPATWLEISHISVLDGAKGNKRLAFALHDPVAFRDRQTGWQRLTSAFHGKANRHHIVISQNLLQDVTADDLLPEALKRHAAANAGP